MAPPSRSLSPRRRTTLSLVVLAVLTLVGCTGEIGADGPGDEPGPDGVDPGSDVVIGSDAGDTTPGADGDGDTTVDPGPPLGPPMPLRQLSRTELANTLEALLGEGAGSPALELLEAPAVIGGFDNNVLSQDVDADTVTRHLEMAEAVGAFVAQNVDLLAPCEAQDALETARDCATAFVVDELAERAWRRPLTDAERSKIAGFFDLGYADPAPNGTAYESGLRLAIEYVLMAPPFLYRLELGEPEAADGERRALDGYELATRLSYFLWRELPDEALIAAAADGRLLDEAGLRAEVERLLDDPRAAAMIGEFHARWLGFLQLAQADKSTTMAPEWDVAAPRLLDATSRLVADLVLEQDAGLGELFSSPRVWVDADTAPLYDIDPATLPEPTDPSGLVRVEVAERLGLLTDPAFLAVTAGKPHFVSPVQRGRYLRERLFCAPIDPPPATLQQDVQDLESNADPTASQDAFDETLENDACVGCHSQLNPVGYGLAAFDTFGRYRPQWHDGSPMLTAGSLIGTDVPAPFDDARGLSARVTESQMVRDCAIQHWFRYAHGVVEDDTAHHRVLDELHGRLATAQDPVRELIVGIATSDAFRHR